ncbi:MAG: hypothetical protein N3D18_02720 [Roseococcus sp.]|nr:hypothetical protein [Roseococcus sp.]
MRRWVPVLALLMLGACAQGARTEPAAASGPSLSLGGSVSGMMMHGR